MDSISLEQAAVYDLNGITALSNNKYVVPRNSNGQTIIQPSSSLLLIEGITTSYLAESVVPLVDTQFRYFSFPARTSVINNSLINLNLNLDFNTGSINIANQTQDPNAYLPFGIPGTYDGELRTNSIMLPSGEQVSAEFQWNESEQEWVQV